MKKRIVLCADDYGQAPAISQGILSLVEKKRLSAVSCMVTMSDWPIHAKWLSPFHHQIDIGLHFNLTEAKMPLGKLMWKALWRQIKIADVRAALEEQIDAFSAAMGFLPQFIDGHQHVHQFPVIRDAVLQVYQERFTDKATYLRLVNTPLNGDIKTKIKKIIIKAMGSYALEKQLKATHIPHNSSFGGIYDFAATKAYAEQFPCFLEEVSQGGLIMCHPGLLPKDSRDPIGEARYREYGYFMDNQFLEDCERGRTKIERFKLD